MQECKTSNKWFTVKILMKLQMKMSTNDSFLIMHFGSSKIENRTLKSKNFTMQITIKVDTKKSSKHIFIAQN